jgi:hypothetical protein
MGLSNWIAGKVGGGRGLESEYKELDKTRKLLMRNLHEFNDLTRFFEKKYFGKLAALTLPVKKQEEVVKLVEKIQSVHLQVLLGFREYAKDMLASVRSIQRESFGVVASYAVHQRAASEEQVRKEMARKLKEVADQYARGAIKTREEFAAAIREAQQLKAS